MKRVVFALVLTMTAFMSYAYAQTNENGKKLFNDKTLAGSSSGKSCNTCHPSGKGIDSAKFAAKDSGLEDIINKCIEGPLKAKALPKDSQELKDIAEYIKSLGKQK
ncbi:MAG: hypothetical protein L7F77_03875 [Candidatus Magnetominusculus sp. LBB02]|nr:hypothetical protein [Candidatus Magnetominusculus sp. LBB02]